MFKLLAVGHAGRGQRRRKVGGICELRESLSLLGEGDKGGIVEGVGEGWGSIRSWLEEPQRDVDD